MSETATLSSGSRPETVSETDKSIIHNLNIELLSNTQVGQVLLPVYEAAIMSDPRLANVRVVPIESSDEPGIGFARADFNFRNADNRHQVHFQLGPEGFEEAQRLLSEHGFSIDVIAGRLKVKTTDITPELLLKFAFLHEMGHTVDYINHEHDYDKYLQQSEANLQQLPIANVTPRYLRSEDGKKFIDDHWEGLRTFFKIDSPEELVRMQSKAYRKMPHEAFADNFASRIMRREEIKRKSLRSLIADALKK